MPAIDDLSNDVWDSIRSLAIRDRTTNVPDEAQLWNLSLVNCAFRDALREPKYRLVFKRVLTKGADAMDKARKGESDQARLHCGVGDVVTMHACTVAYFFISMYKMNATHLFDRALGVSFRAAQKYIDGVGVMADVLGNDDTQCSLGKIIRCKPDVAKLLDELTRIGT